jgi:hypothetical protein
MRQSVEGQISQLDDFIPKIAVQVDRVRLSCITLMVFPLWSINDREQTKYVHLLADTDNGEVDEELDGLDFDALEKSAEQD